MDVSSFLKALPGVLGLATFLTFIWPGKARISGEIFTSIVKKLRAAPNVHIDDYERLTPAKIVKLFESDRRVQGAINDKEIQFLRLLVILQQAREALVLLTCAALIGLSLWLLRRPQPPDHDAPLAGQHSPFGNQHSRSLAGLDGEGAKIHRF